MTEVQRYTQGIADLMQRSESCQLVLGWAEMLCVLAACQLALRHPNMPSTAAANVRVFVQRAISEVEVITPDLAEILRMGDDPRYDV